MLKVLDIKQVGLHEFPLETLRKKNANHNFYYVVIGRKIHF